MTDPQAFRAEFPVLERLAYLNAGTEGPIPQRAADAVRDRLAFETDGGRAGRPYFESVLELAERLRSGYASVLHCEPGEVALTGSTTDGVNTVIGGLALGPGDEVLTTDEEHPGVLAPLGRARRRFGITVKVVPFDEIAGAVSPQTKLIACSHVSWVNGQVVDAPALAATAVPVLLDAAQGIGAVPVDVKALGCDYYAASGQKWMCGPEGSGCLYVRESRLDELLMPWPGYGSVENSDKALEFDEPKQGAARFDHGFPPGMRSAWALASMEVFEEAGWDWVHERAASQAESLARGLSAKGIDVQPRGRSTLVSWKVQEAQPEVERLAAERFVVRSIPGRELVRVSVGAWSSEEELERLLQTA